MAPEHFSHPLHSNSVSPDFWKGKSRSPASFFFSISGKISDEVRVRGWGSGFEFGLRRSPWPDLEGRPGVASRPGGGGGRGAVRPAAAAPSARQWRRPVGSGRGRGRRRPCGVGGDGRRGRRKSRGRGRVSPEPRAGSRLGKQGGGRGAGAEEGGGWRLKMNSASKIHHR